MNPKEFKEIYNKAKVWNELDDAIDKLTFEQIEQLALNLEEVRDWASLDMRQNYLLSNLNAKLYVKNKMSYTLDKIDKDKKPY